MNRVKELVSLRLDVEIVYRALWINGAVLTFSERFVRLVGLSDAPTVFLLDATKARVY